MHLTTLPLTIYNGDGQGEKDNDNKPTVFAKGEKKK